MGCLDNSMIAQGYKECNGYNTVALNDIGFFMYRVIGEECHVGHLYVAPTHRKLGLGHKVIGKEILKTAKDNKCSYLSCVVDFKDREAATASHLVKCYLNFGFDIHLILNNTQIILKRDI
jgi:GNAT superfamily N-acetyltransferase